MRRLLVMIGVLAIVTTVLIALQAAWDARAYDVNALARRTPRDTALMRERISEARNKGRTLDIDQRWVPYTRISPLLRRAVLVAEDDAFYSHDGLDWNEIREAAKRNLETGRVVRGGSTITQQLAKNLFLGDARTPTRKLRELFLALRLERALSKRRIFELYLNLIEWGNGVFGVEAAARRYFGVSSADLDARQACLLAAVIINPRRFSPLAPGKRIERRVRMIASRLRRRGYLSDTEYSLATGRPEAEAPPADLAPVDTGPPPKVDTEPPAPADTDTLASGLPTPR